MLVTSTFEYLPGLPVHVSEDLVEWRHVGHVLHRPEQLDLRGIPSSSGLYAPTIRVIDGRLVVVCTVVGPDDGSWTGRTGHFLVSADDPAGPWSDPIWIEGAEGFDPSLTVDGDRVWICAARVADTGPAAWPGRTEVWVAPLDLLSGALCAEPVVIWTGAAARAVWAEGPHVVAHPDGGWMLVVAEGGTELEHAVCVAYSDRVAGPYRGDPGNPRFTHRDLGSAAEITAVGHADLVEDAQGRTWATVLATHPVQGRPGLLGRRTSLVPVEWDEGRPLFAPGIGRVQAEVEVVGLPDRPPPSGVLRDGFDSGAFDLAWTGVGHHPAAFAVLDGSGALLRAGSEPDRPAGLAFLGRRLPSERAVAQMAVGDVPATARAGILLRVSDDQWLELAIDGNGEVTAALGPQRRWAIARRSDGGGATLALRIVDLEATPVVDGRPTAPIALDAVAPRTPRGFVGAWVGPVAIGEGDCRILGFELNDLSAR